MDFFERQNHARTLTNVLVAYLIVAVVAIVASVDLLALGAYTILHTHPLQTHVSSHGNSYSADDTSTDMANGEIALVVMVSTLVTLMMIGGACAYQFSALSGGGRAVATLLGGRLIAPNTDDPAEKRLLDVVSEMAIASGIAVPAVYVLASESNINACATGFSSRDGVIAVTSGALKYLNRDELQGVVAHEFSHLLNGDTRLDIRLICLLHGILFLNIIGLTGLRACADINWGRSRNGGGAIALLMLASGILAAIGYIGAFFARLIQAAVSRQREFLADASAVQFTRNPGGLAGALKKIGGLDSQIRNANAIGAAHVFFANAMGEPVTQWMATHPPLVERIKLLEPGFDGTFPSMAEARAEIREARYAAPLPHYFSDGEPRVRCSLNVGRPQWAHVQYAAVLLASLPPDLRQIAADPMSARALIYAMVLSSDQGLRDAQRDVVTRQGDSVALSEMMQLAVRVAALTPAGRLALVNLSVPALQHLSDAQLSAFLTTLQGLIDAGGPESIFEYTLSAIVRNRLRPSGAAAGQAPVGYYATRPLLPHLATILAGLAYAGSTDGDVQKAFACGMACLDSTWKDACPAPPGMSEIDAALNRLRLASPAIRSKLVDACGRCVASDGVVKEDEAELMRAICLMLDCPLPPLLQGPASA